MSLPWDLPGTSLGNRWDYHAAPMDCSAPMGSHGPTMRFPWGFQGFTVLAYGSPMDSHGSTVRLLWDHDALMGNSCDSQKVLWC